MVVYRTSMQIVADLLVATDQCGQEGIKTTSLLTKANLSHSRLEKFVSNLTGAELINKIEYDGKNVFVITPKGRQYLEQYKKFADVAGSSGLEMYKLFLKFSSSLSIISLSFFLRLIRTINNNCNYSAN